MKIYYHPKEKFLSLYNKGCISTKEASFIVFDLHFISKSSLLYIMIMFKFSSKGTNFIL